jgi:hypothetical protein
MLTTLVLMTTLMQAVIPDPNAIPSKSEVLAAIDRFIASPGPTEDARAINVFADKSDACTVNIADDVLTWLRHQPQYKYNGALVTGFIAGNVKSQLDSGKAVDDSYAGVLATFKVYEKLQQRDKDFKVPEIEEQMAMEKKGELKAWIEKQLEVARQRQPKK